MPGDFQVHTIVGDEVDIALVENLASSGSLPAMKWRTLALNAEGDDKGHVNGFGEAIMRACGTPRQLSSIVVTPIALFNRLQDPDSMTIVLDLRPAGDYLISHISAAHPLDPFDMAHLDTLLDGALLGTCRDDQEFVVVLVLTGSLDCDNDAGRAGVVSNLSCRGWKAKAALSGIWCVSFAPYLQTCPFACSDCPGFQEDMMLPSLVWPEPRVYLAPWALSSTPYVFQALGVSHVVNCTPDHPHMFEKQAKYCRVPVQDRDDEDIRQYLDVTVAFMNEAARHGGIVLCHCNHGQSRSAVVLAAWLVSTQRFSVPQAIAHLKSCRPRVRPIRGFITQLTEWAG